MLVYRPEWLFVVCWMKIEEDLRRWIFSSFSSSSFFLFLCYFLFLSVGCCDVQFIPVVVVVVVSGASVAATIIIIYKQCIYKHSPLLGQNYGKNGASLNNKKTTTTKKKGEKSGWKIFKRDDFSFDLIEKHYFQVSLSSSFIYYIDWKCRML